MALHTLKSRDEFLRIRGGARWSSASFVLETRPRQPTERVAADNLALDNGTPDKAATAQDVAPVVGQPTAPTPPRFGFTVTKKLGNAVVRNRIRRRLKAAVGLLASTHARPGHDYVLIARSPALVRAFADLKKELEDALHRVHHGPRQRQKPRD